MMYVCLLLTCHPRGSLRQAYLCLIWAYGALFHSLGACSRSLPIDQIDLNGCEHDATPIMAVHDNTMHTFLSQIVFSLHRFDLWKSIKYHTTIHYQPQEHRYVWRPLWHHQLALMLSLHYLFRRGVVYCAERLLRSLAGVCGHDDWEIQSIYGHKA